jgi:hypothetical protein
MRFVKLVLVIFALSAPSGLLMAQSQSETTPPQELNFAKSVQLFPNPATEFIDVKIDQFPADKINLTLHNIIGNKLEVETEVLGEHLIRVKVKELASGYYLLAVKDEESKFRGTYKFLKR